MEIILLEKVNKLGDIGQIVKVKTCMQEIFYFQTKLQYEPRKKINKYLKSKKNNCKKQILKKKKIAENLIIKAPDSVIIFREASEQGALFGSVTSRDVINEINNISKLDIKAKDFTIKQTIKKHWRLFGATIITP